MTTYLSGIQPSGRPHLGNYFGAIAQHIALQEEGGEHFYFIADYHALTTSRDPGELRGRVFETALTYLALGLDPERATLFRQSEVPEVTELCWLVSCTSGMGVLERAVSFKDKVQKGISPSIGLFLYPALMAADILAYDSDVVPVGMDQVQHVEIARDLAAAFNAAYGETFVLPRVRVSPHAKVPGLDGEKMSKSYGNDVWIFESGKPLKKQIARIVTDSRPPEEPKDPEGLLLFEFLRLFLPPAELEDWKERVRAGARAARGAARAARRGRGRPRARRRARRRARAGDRGRRGIARCARAGCGEPVAAAGRGRSTERFRSRPVASSGSSTSREITHSATGRVVQGQHRLYALT